MTTETPDSKRPRRWLTVLLVLSLAVNLLIVGVIGGWILSPDGPRDKWRSNQVARGFLAEPFLRALPKEGQREVQSRMREIRVAPAARADMRARVTAIISAIRADPFDPDAIRALLDQQRRDVRGRQEAGESVLLEVLSEMTVEERGAYADQLERTIRRLMQRNDRR